MDYLEQSGVLEDVNSAFDSTSTDQLLDVDGNVVGEIIRDNQGNIISSSGISSNNWLNYAYEFGGTINEGISYSNLLSNVLDVIPEWVYDAGFETAQAAYDAMQEAGVIAAPSSMGQEGSSSIFRGLEAVGNVVDIFDETGQQAEQQEEQEEDILADTTEESSIIEDLFNDYMEDFRVEFESQQNITIEQVQEVVANLLGGIEQPETLTEEEIEQIVSGAVSSIPQADTLSEEQIDTLVNSAINSVRIDLETAETERQEIRAGQEAIRSELSGDIQSLEERLNNLPPEIREIVSEQLENLEITEDISSVRQAITALEEVVSNIQPGTTPEQVEEQIEQADLVTSEQLETTAEGLFAAIQAMAEGQTVELTTAQSQLLAEIAQGDAETIERLSQFEGQLEDYLEERNITFDTVTGELSSDIERLEEQAAEFETRTEERFEESAQERAEIYQGLLNRLDEFRQGTEVDLSETEIRVLSEVTGVEERLLQQASENAEEFNALLAEQGIQFEEVTDSLRADIAASEQRTGERIVGLEERMDANAIQQLSQLTGLRTEFLETLSASEAAAIARNQGLSDQIAEQITGIRGETAAQIEGINERLTERINEYETLTGEQLEIAEEQRAALGGQLGTLTTDVAQVIEDVIRANGRIEDLDEAARLRYEELGLSIEDLSSRIGVNLEALQEGILTQESAMRELIEETTQQTEESLTQRLEEAEQGFATSLSNTEANLLSQITGIESGVLQQIAEVEGGLQEQFGEGFGQVQDQVAGIGEGLGELGQTLGAGLLGLAAAQPTAQQIASAMPRQPVKFDPFLKGLSPFQPLTPLSLSPVQEKDALSELNKFIGRQSGMLV